MKKILFVLLFALYSHANATLVMSVPYHTDTSDVSSYHAVENGWDYTIVDSSIYINGAYQFVGYPDAPQYNLSTWYYISMDWKPVSSVTWRSLIGKWSYQSSPSGGNEYTLIQLPDWSVELVMITTTGTHILPTSTWTFPNWEWHNIAFSYDSANSVMKIYKDWAVVSEYFANGQMVHGNSDINVWSYSTANGGNQSVNWYIKNLKIYNTPEPTGGSCEIITQPSTITQSILNRGEVNEIDTGNEIYKALTAGSGTYIQLLNVKDVVHFPEMIENTEPMTLKSSNALIWSKPLLYIQGSNGITSIDLTHSNLGEVTLYRYNKSSVLLSTQIYDTSEKINITKSDVVVIEFKKSFFEYSIESIYIDTQTITGQERELCQVDGGYTLDWEPYLLWGTGSLSEISTPPTNEWTFSTSWYTFYNNGFCLQNFVPYPYGGTLSFDIVSPDGTMQNTKEFWPYESDGNWYGFDSCVKVTTFYHETAGVYKVRVKYSYAGQSIYPFGTDYNNYTISLPESNDNEAIDWNYEACNWDQETTGWLPWVSNFFNCLSSTISQFIKDSYENMTKVASFIKSLWGFFTLEEKSPMSYIIPWVYADNVPWFSGFEIRDSEGYKNSPLGKMEKLFKGFVITIFVLLTLILVASRRKNDNNK